MNAFRQYRRVLVGAALVGTALAVALACSTKSPTEPGSGPISPKVPPPTTTFQITVTANPGHLTIGQSTGSRITVSVVNTADGTPPPDLTSITLSSTLGEFSAVGSGTRSLTLQLSHGQAQAVLFPGTSVGTATIGASNPSPPVGITYVSGSASVSITSAGTFFLNSVLPNTGDPSGGLVVTISGGGILAPVAVSFGNSSAPVKSVSPNSIQVISPPSATPVPVGSTLQVSITVTNNIGGTQAGSATLNNAFTYVPGGGGIQQPQIFSVTPASGTNDGGTQVTITGQFFVAPVQVFFGSGSASNFNGIEATVQSVTANQIIVVSPPARGFGQDNTNQLVSILVKNVSSGFSTIATAAFKYGSKVIVTSAGPTITNFNQPVKVTIFGQGFADPVAVSLAGVAAQVLSTSGTEIQVLSGMPVISGCSNITGPVQVTNINNGDSGSGPAFTYVVPKPVIVDVTSTRNDPTGGYPADIHGAFFIPGEDQVLFGSSGATVNPGSSATDLLVTVPPFTGTFPTGPCGANNAGTQELPTAVTVQVTDGLTSCTATLSGGFTYIPTGYPNNCVVPPPAAPSASFVFSVPHASQTVTFTDTSTGNPTSWAWNFGDGMTSNQQNPVHTYAAPGTYNVVLKVSNAGGTSAPATQMVTVPGP